MKIKTYTVCGIVYASLKIAGVQGGYVARGGTSGEAIENVILLAMNSKRA
jgi:hypothetical protein